jgi:hypothetical protein
MMARSANGPGQRQLQPMVRDRLTCQRTPPRRSRVMGEEPHAAGGELGVDAMLAGRA